ncbi:hypothetical protein MKW98_004216 [Papaver atlanticum]|uniref:Uncharacterized protein n=1 Tax=Papaver atlanticum TaxID=357466 RepID=A0AAD4T6A9_9MAGN|nr:hypothetical protein MKW98_004216 [Papaver atlanticum]
MMNFRMVTSYRQGLKYKILGAYALSISTPAKPNIKCLRNVPRKIEVKAILAFFTHFKSDWSFIIAYVVSIN